MEQQNDFTLDQPTEEHKRTDMLKVLCILSFIAIGLEILAFGTGALLLFMSPETSSEVFENMSQSNAQFADQDPVEFFNKIGLFSLYGLIATIVSLIGVIMMWRLDRIGLIVYTIAELSTHFFKMDLGNGQGNSTGGLIFGLVIDLAFIGLYFSQLKYFKKKLA